MKAVIQPTSPSAPSLPKEENEKPSTSRNYTYVLIAIPAIAASLGALVLIHIKGGHSLGFLNPFLEKMGTTGAYLSFGVSLTSGVTYIAVKSYSNYKAKAHPPTPEHVPLPKTNTEEDGSKLKDSPQAVTTEQQSHVEDLAEFPFDLICNSSVYLSAQETKRGMQPERYRTRNDSIEVEGQNAACFTLITSTETRFFKTEDARRLHIEKFLKNHVDEVLTKKTIYSLAFKSPWLEISEKGEYWPFQITIDGHLLFCVVRYDHGFPSGFFTNEADRDQWLSRRKNALQSLRETSTFSGKQVNVLINISDHKQLPQYSKQPYIVDLPISSRFNIENNSIQPSPLYTHVYVLITLEGHYYFKDEAARTQFIQNKNLTPTNFVVISKNMLLELHNKIDKREYLPFTVEGVPFLYVKHTRNRWEPESYDWQLLRFQTNEERTHEINSSYSNYNQAEDPLHEYSKTYAWATGMHMNPPSLETNEYRLVTKLFTTKYPVSDPHVYILIINKTIRYFKTEAARDAALEPFKKTHYDADKEEEIIKIARENPPIFALEVGKALCLPVQFESTTYFCLVRRYPKLPHIVEFSVKIYMDEEECKKYLVR